jgi:hypothetical protein
VIALVRFRRHLKVGGRQVEAALLRGVVNSLVYGNFARFDERRQKIGDTWLPIEVPGPYSCMPLASAVSAGAHLLLALLERLVTDRSGVISYRDTDSAHIPSTSEGGIILLDDGFELSLLTHAQLFEVIGLFDPLSPAAWWPVWKVTGMEKDR